MPAFSLKPGKEVEGIILKWFVQMTLPVKQQQTAFNYLRTMLKKNADLVSSAVTDTNVDINLVKKHFTRDGWNQGLKNSLARRPGLVISTFGLAEIISCMPDGLVKKNIGY